MGIQAFVEASLSRHIKDDRFELNQYGKAIENSWFNLRNVFDDIFMDEYVIMPNHFHGIIGFGKHVRQTNTGKYADLGKVISRFKNDSRKAVISVYENENGEAGSPLRIDNFNPYKFWQKSFYDHVIRNEQDLQRIREYIVYNPLNWHLDSLNPSNIEN